MNDSRSDTVRQVVIVGGGFAGTALAAALERRLPAAWRVVLVSEESYTTFNPMLAEVVGASVFPEHVVAPIRQMLGRTRAGEASRFVMGRVTTVDREAKVVLAETLAGVQPLRYDQLVLAFGTRAHLALLPGLAEHALPLKLVGDALQIRNRVLQRLARIELESDPELRRRLGHFVVIGGGFSGVEVAGELADVLKSARRWYPRVGAGELRVTLLHDGAVPLPELPRTLGEAAATSLRSRGVDVRVGAKARAVHADGVELDDGEHIDGATVICTIGTRPNPLVERLGLTLQRGRIVAAPDLSVVGTRDLWTLGDCALITNAQADGAFAPPTAQFAVAEAQALARNLADRLAGLPTRSFAYRSRGMMATTGHLKGVALVGPLRLTGLPAWLLWRAYYLLRMPTLGRKLRLWVEWTWAMCFSADITHLRFTGTREVDVPRAQAAP